MNPLIGLREYSSIGGGRVCFDKGYTAVVSCVKGGCCSGTGSDCEVGKMMKEAPALPDEARKPAIPTDEGGWRVAGGRKNPVINLIEMPGPICENSCSRS